MAKNKSLSKAQAVSRDEFYTRLEDVENELRHYQHHFKGKTVFCNCDDPFESAFFTYFAMNFNAFGLKKLIATSYTGSPIAGSQLPFFETAGLQSAQSDKQAYKVEITEVIDRNDDGAVDLLDVEHLLRHDANVIAPISGDGDFRSKEAVALLKESDIVVSNPPFSLWREYVAQLIEHDKKFIIIGSLNAITYAEIFPLLKEDKLWLGYGFTAGNAYFKVPESYQDTFVGGVFNPKTGLVKFRNVGWYTNLDIKKRHEDLTLFKRYKPTEYPAYDNYDAIDVSKTAEIPYDWAGVMGVPISFMNRYSPEQFEILGITDRHDLHGLKVKTYTAADAKNHNDLNRRGAIRQSDGSLKSTYARILIRHRRPEIAGS